MVGDRQSLASFLHAFLDLIQGFAVRGSSTVRPRALRSVTLTFLRFLRLFRFSRAGMSFNDSARADLLQVGLLPFEQLR